MLANDHRLVIARVQMESLHFLQFQSEFIGIFTSSHFSEGDFVINDLFYLLITISMGCISVQSGKLRLFLFVFDEDFR